MEKNFVKSILTGIVLLLVLTSFVSALEKSSGNVVAGIWFDNLPTTNSLTVNDGTNVAFNVYGLALGSSLNVKADLILQNGTIVPIADVFQSSRNFNEFGVGSQGDYSISQTEYGGVGNHVLRLTVNGVVLDLNLTVSAVPVNNAPVFTSVPVLTVNEGVAYSYDADGFDVDMDTLTYSLSTNPLGFSINPTTGVITGTAPIVTGNQNYNVVVTVADGNGGFDNQVYTLTVLDTIVPPPADTNAPIVTILSPTNTAFTSPRTQLTYTAVDPESNLFQCWYSTDLGVTNSTAVACSGTFSITSVNGINTWTVYASDNSGNIGSQTVTFSVNPSSSGNGGGSSSHNKKVTYSDPDEGKLVEQESFIAPKINLTPEVEKSWLARLIEWIINFLKRIFS
ncbi:MAG: putative Ig domain-containing protein [Nanoarchaeota archaeon]